MEKIEEVNTETLTSTTEVQQEVGQQVSGIVQAQNDEAHQAERIQMRNAMHNLPDFDVQMARRHPLRILLAEDSLVNIKIALWFLRKLGYHADVAFNGIEVIDALKRRSYDAILMDAEMPEMDGRQATMLIRKEFAKDQQPTIIAMTANVQHGDREEYLSLGMNDYITKPLKMEDLIRALSASKPTPASIMEEVQKIRKVA
ncbi:MAG: response regulator [Bacteroidetes bacterium]|nr:response regulator [Bacteroidota bacterium]